MPNDFIDDPKEVETLLLEDESKLTPSDRELNEHDSDNEHKKIKRTKSVNWKYLVGALFAIVLCGGGYYSYSIGLFDQVDSVWPQAREGIPTTPAWQIAIRELKAAHRETAQQNQRALSELHQKNLSLEGQLNSVVSLVESLSNQNFELRNANSAISAELNQLVNRLDGLSYRISNQSGSVVQFDSTHIDTQIAKLKQDIERLSDNSGWYHNRIEKLEKQSIATPSKKLSTATVVAQARTPVKTLVPYTLVGIPNERLAFVANRVTKERIRIVVGRDLPKCGKVEVINVKLATVQTKNCMIKQEDI